MAKSKAPTPQELYRARKQREEQEKVALLPPGLINHGNTCFMNSVLQGLIATRLLSDLAHFKPIPPLLHQHSDVVVASRKSPLLTNGHNLGGQYEKAWVNSMPIGDVFLDLMVKSWSNQSSQKRESLSPKPLLSALGQKYEQYLDFAQQDAHEFLRILLDASRMEELDVIKKRQPPPEKVKKSRRTTITPSNGYLPSKFAQETPNQPNLIPEQDRLSTVADMVFGGRFASILVCQECKHVSLTYEDFNDISLSIKAEDYHERKRDRLKTLAKKLASFPTTSLTVAHDVPRPSSVPPSPREREDRLGGYEDPPNTHERRRRSFDIGGQDTSTDQGETSATDTRALPSESTLVGSSNEGAVSNEEKHVEIIASPKPEKKDRKDDGWTKFSRRISMTVGLGKPLKERKSRSRDRTSKDLSAGSARPDVSSNDVSESGTSTDNESSVKPTSASSIDTTHLSSPPSASPRSSTSPLGADPSANHRTSSPAPSLHRNTTCKPRLPHTRENKHSKPLKPPKPTPEELNYLREILADVGPSSLSNPFALFNNQISASSRPASSSSATHNLWLSSNYSGIEECLRMFTAVEVLDGENMVGCRRCWKIANGEYQKSPAQEDDEDEDDDSDSLDHSHPDTAPNGIANPSPESTPKRPPFLGNIPMSISTPVIPLYSHTNASGDGGSISSLAASERSSLPESGTSPTASEEESHGTPTPGGLPIPSISTTGPESPTRATIQPNSAPPLPPPLDRSTSLPTVPMGLSIAQPSPRPGQILDHLPPLNQPGHLPVPNSRQIRFDHETEESSGAESDASAATSTHSVESSTPAKAQTSPRKKPKPVIMRSAYKRYLIGTPPPVLVIHLKRFQQISKTHILSFSHGFKKLDDFVTFPEFLDLTPYLAPRKEDFGLEKKGKADPNTPQSGKRSSKDNVGKCMYRLYAVVVHIGSMLGGHYIAYAALPSSPSTESSASGHGPEGTSTTSNTSTPPRRQWAYISDTIVRLTTLEEVLKAKAYLCFYERI